MRFASSENPASGARRRFRAGGDDRSGVLLNSICHDRFDVGRVHHHRRRGASGIYWRCVDGPIAHRACLCLCESRRSFRVDPLDGRENPLDGGPKEVYPFHQKGSIPFTPKRYTPFDQRGRPLQRKGVDLFRPTAQRVFPQARGLHQNARRYVKSALGAGSPRQPRKNWGTSKFLWGVPDNNRVQPCNSIKRNESVFERLR